MNIVWFKDKKAQDINIVGGKAANLAIMASFNLPVPPGFSVTAEAYKNFLESNNIDEQIYSILDKLDVEDSERLHEAAEEIQNIIIGAEIPHEIKQDIIEAYENLNIDIDVYKMAGKKALDIIKAGREMPFVAVRSSATAEDAPEASFAGQNATFLNIKGPEEVAKAVQKCWASLFTARSIYYRVKNNFEHRKVLIAVVVQKMVASDKSGVIFTANPVTNNENEIVIECGFGLGEAVVSGAITPDEYIVDKETLKIKDRKVNVQKFSFIRDINLGRTIKHNLYEEEGSVQKLNNDEIIKLARYAIQIEEHYKKPQDIEFAIERNKIFIVQTRPITTLKSPYIKEEEIKKEKPEFGIKVKDHIVLEGLAASPYVGSGPVKIVLDLNNLNKIREGDILVTMMTNPDFVPALKKVNGIITDEGGLTSHAAIVSREMGKSCVVGTLKATRTLEEGEIVTVDGIHGKVYRGEVEISKPIEETKKTITEKIETVTEVKVNVDLPEYADEAAATNADGIGLLRCEFMLAETKEHPGYLIKQGRKEELIKILVDHITRIANLFKGKPIWYRTSDFRSDEYRNLKGGEEEPKEDNPMLGWHGIRRGLDQVELLKAEFEAIKKVHDSGFTHVGVMIPMVISVEEVRKSKELLKEIGLEPLEEIEFGVMVETPAAVQIIEDICKEGIDFISFGTNDLTQFTLAIDRNNTLVQKNYNEMHPAVLKEIEKVIKTCKEYNVETSICGQAGSREDMVEWLVKKGIDSVSANIDAVEKIREVVRKAERSLLVSLKKGSI